MKAMPTTVLNKGLRLQFEPQRNVQQLRLHRLHLTAVLHNIKVP
jgi:hypothetical protein